MVTLIKRSDIDLHNALYEAVKKAGINPHFDELVDIAFEHTIANTHKKIDGFFYAIGSDIPSKTILFETMDDSDIIIGISNISAEGDFEYEIDKVYMREDSSLHPELLTDITFKLAKILLDRRKKIQ